MEEMGRAKAGREEAALVTGGVMAAAWATITAEVTTGTERGRESPAWQAKPRAPTGAGEGEAAGGVSKVTV